MPVVQIFIQLVALYYNSRMELYIEKWVDNPVEHGKFYEKLNELSEIQRKCI